MNRINLILALIPMALAAQITTPPRPTPIPVMLPPGYQYPVTRKGDQVDDYHGTRVADPYRWLEDTDSPETRAWIEAQNAVTFGYLNGIPQRGAIRERVSKLWNYE